MASKGFSRAIQSQDIEDASAELNEAEALISDDSSLGTLQKQLLEAKWNKSSNSLSTFLSNSELSKAKGELSKLQNLNIQPGKTAALAGQLADAVKKAIIADVSRGKDALCSGDLEGASKALADAKDIDSSNLEVSAFQNQIGDFKYASGMSSVAADVSDNKMSEASGVLDKVLSDRRDDPVAVHLKALVVELEPIMNAKQFMPGAKGNNQTGSTGNVTYKGRVIAWSTKANANRPPAYIVCSNESNEDFYRVTVEPHVGDDPFSQWASSGGKAPSIGTSVLVFGGPVSGPFDDNDSSTSLGVTSLEKHRRFSLNPVKILPIDYIEKQKSTIISEIKGASSGSR